MPDPTVKEALDYLGNVVVLFGFIYTGLRGLEYYLGAKYYQHRFKQLGLDLNLLDAMREYHYSKKSDD